jgi:hypothetical protein
MSDARGSRPPAHRPGEMAPDPVIRRLAELGRPIVEGGRLGEYNEFLQRSFPTWVAIRAHDPAARDPAARDPAAAMTDPILALFEAYEVEGVTIANFKFQPLTRDDDLVYFGCEGATDLYLRAVSCEVYSMYYKESFPSALGQSSADFLACLLLDAEFISSCSRRCAEDPATRTALLTEFLHRMREKTSLERWLAPFERALGERQP